MRTVAVALALLFVVAPTASAKKHHAAAKHAKKASKRAKKLVTVSQSRPTRVAAVEHRAAPSPSLPEVASPPAARVEPTAASSPAATPSPPPSARPSAAPAAPIDRSHPAEQLSDDEVPGARIKKR